MVSRRARDVAARALAGTTARSAPPGEMVFGPIPTTAVAILEEMRSLRRGQALVAYRYGQLLIALSTRPMLAELGKESLDEVLEEHPVIAKVMAAKYMAFARAFQPAQAKGLTLDKGLAIVRYAEKVRAGRITPGALVEANAALGAKKVSEHTGASIEKLITDWLDRERAARDAGDDTLAETDHAVDVCGPSLRGAGIKASLRRVRRRDGFKVVAELDPDDAILLAQALKELVKLRRKK